MVNTIHLQLLLATFAGWVGRQQSHVTAYLIEENRVLKEQLKSGGGRLRFTDDRRRRLVAKAKRLGRKALRQIATILTPDTFLARSMSFGKHDESRRPNHHREPVATGTLP
jgi:hypothetical protein